MSTVAGEIHDHGGLRATISGRSSHLLTAAAVAGAVITVAAMLWVGFAPSPHIKDRGLLITKVYDATVVAVRLGPCTGTSPRDNVTCHRVTYRLNAGPKKGARRTQDFPVSPTSPNLHKGDHVVLGYEPTAAPPDDFTYTDRERRRVLAVLFLVFAGAVVLLGRMHGIGALLGLGLSLALILRFVLPAILAGHSPVVVAVVASSAIAYLVLYLANGFRPLTTVALLGTLGALSVTVALSAIVTAVAHFSGLTSDDTAMLQVLSGRVDVSGLILAGIVLGSLGALDDMTVTQASAVGELVAANPAITRTELYAAEFVLVGITSRRR